MVTTGKSKRENVYNKLSGRCCYCGDTLDYETFHIEHLTPKSQGGKSDIQNLHPACCLCNLTKGSLTVEDYRKKITELSSKNIAVKLFLKHHRATKKTIVFYFEQFRG